jgi:hypothetical protein
VDQAIKRFLADADARKMKPPSRKKYRVLTDQLKKYADRPQSPKPQHPDEYMRLAREFIGPERSKLLDRVIADRRSYTFVLSDWLKIEAGLTQELRTLQNAS